MFINARLASYLLGLKPVTLRVMRHQRPDRLPSIRIDDRTHLYSLYGVVKFAIERSANRSTRPNHVAIGESPKTLSEDSPNGHDQKPLPDIPAKPQAAK